MVERVGRSPATWRVAGALGASALAAASWGAGSRPTLNTGIVWPGLARWSDTGGSPVLATVSIAAMAVIVVAWWQLRDAKVTLRWWRVTAVAWFVPLVASLPLYSRDLYSYAAQGALWAQGTNPYEHGVASLDSDWKDSTAPTWLDSTVPYGPVWLIISRLSATVAGDHLLIALLLLRLLAVAAVAAIGWAVADLSRRLDVVDAARATWLGVAAPLVGAHFVSGAHNDALMVAGVLVGLAVALRGRFVIACVVISLAAMVKVTALVAVPFVALLWAARGPAGSDPADSGSVARGSAARILTWWAVVRAGVASTLATAGPVLVVGLSTGLGFGWLNPASTQGKNEQWTSLPTALGMAAGAIGHLLGHDDWRDTAIATARSLALAVMLLVLVLLWLTTARHARETARVVRAVGHAFLAVVVLAPAFLGWYYLWILPVLAVTTSPERHRRRVTVVAVVATILCFAQLPDGYSLGLTTTAVGVPIMLVATVLLLRAAATWVHATKWRHFLALDAAVSHDAGGPRTLG